ncbi:MAG TPA: class I SAM-dependent methyltransferase [Bryobacteraceae bacterium]|jgi:hypothetical protein
MIFRLVDTRNESSLASKMRRSRMSHLFEIIESSAESKPLRVLDVGGTEGYWRTVWNEACDGLEITLLNVEAEPVTGALPTVAVAGDARQMSQFKDRQFHLCFSNSVIEHVGTIGDQKRMADEIRRVAKACFVQTPYRYFPIEPHYLFPGWAGLPVWVRTALHRRIDLGWVKAEPDYVKARQDVESCRLLSLKEFRMLFPDSQIVLERIGPFIKSMIAVRKG